jgi:hypothetical protein
VGTEVFETQFLAAEFKLAAPTVAQALGDPAGAYAVLPDHGPRTFNLAEIGLNDARAIGSVNAKGRHEEYNEQNK